MTWLHGNCYESIHSRAETDYAKGISCHILPRLPLQNRSPRVLGSALTVITPFIIIQTGLSKPFSADSIRNI